MNPELVKLIREKIHRDPREITRAYGFHDWNAVVDDLVERGYGPDEHPNILFRWKNVVLAEDPFKEAENDKDTSPWTLYILSEGY